MKIIKFVLLNIFFIVLVVISILLGNKEGQYFSYMLGIISGIWIVSLFLSLKDIKNKKKVKIEYDERQLLKRGKCYEKSFLTLIFLLIFDGYIRLMFNLNWSDYLVGVLVSIIISLTVFAVTAIMNDAYQTINSNKKSFTLFSFILSAFNLFSFMSQVIHHKIIVDSMVTPYILNLVTAVFSLIIGITLLYKKIKDKNDYEES